MENASKAFIFAAEILVAVLVLAIGVRIINIYSKYSEDYEESRTNQNLVQLNTKFEKYLDKTLTIQDALTLTNLAKDYNERTYNVKPITVYFINENVMNKKYSWWVDKINNNNDKTFSLSIIKDTDNETIKELRIN